MSISKDIAEILSLVCFKQEPTLAQLTNMRRNLRRLSARKLRQMHNLLQEFKARRQLLEQLQKSAETLWSNVPEIHRNALIHGPAHPLAFGKDFFTTLD